MVSGCDSHSLRAGWTSLQTLLGVVGRPLRFAVDQLYVHRDGHLVTHYKPASF